MNVQLLDVDRDYDRVAQAWQALCEQSAHSYYLSWGWIGTWLHSLRQRDVRLNLALVWDGAEVVAAFFLGHQRFVRHGWIRSRGLLLNATGVRDYDAVYIEFNGILAKPGLAWRMHQFLAELPAGWQELVLPGLDREAFPGNALDQDLGALRTVVIRDDDAHFVDLDAVRQHGDYLALLSGSTRSQIRRSIRRYAERGEIAFEVADTVERAEAVFDELVTLHRETWAARGKHSRFVSDYVLEFHRELIRRRFASGEIQLARLKAGEWTLGALYNFRYRGRIYNYQTGIRYDADNRLKPGLMCHAEAVAFNAANGETSYEFLAGNSRYKSSLATGRRRLTWVRLQKPHPQFWLERQLKGLKQAVKRRPGIALPAGPE